jgi:hypothetical protein
MNEDYSLNTVEAKTNLTFFKTTVLLTWILFKLTLLASMLNKVPAEFIYAGF